MGELWIIFVLIYGLLKGTREGMKKAALKKSGSIEILFFYTLVGFILTLPYLKVAIRLEPIYIFWAFIKAAVCCTAWFFSLKAIKSMSVGLYGIIDLTRMIFSTLLGVFILGESFTLNKAIGILLVLLGLFLVNAKKNTSTKGLTAVSLTAALLCCFFNAISGTLDKILMRYMTSPQLQFWFMFFMALIYAVIIIIRKEKISFHSIRTNYWIPLMSISLVLGDLLLFEANANPESQVTVMTVIKQSSVIVTILTGWLVFKEKNILYKLICTLIILSGIFVALLS